MASDTSIGDTDREAIIRARRGQGLFKQHVMDIESKCRITGVGNPIHLVASHCKPWRDSSNEERLDGENGLLLMPSIDHLFDRGFIDFEDSGDLIVSQRRFLPRPKTFCEEDTAIPRRVAPHRNARLKRRPATVLPATFSTRWHETELT